MLLIHKEWVVLIMEKAILAFIEYLHRSKGSSKNTEDSYRRDLTKLSVYLRDKLNIDSWDKVTLTDLNSYMLYMEEQNAAPSSVCRSIASIRTFFKYLNKKKITDGDPAEELKAPKLEKKVPVILSVEEVDALISCPSTKTPKGLRDRAMLELLYATGIRVSELINLKLTDLNLTLSYIVCDSKAKERIIPFGKSAKSSLVKYLNSSRASFTGNTKKDNGYLFTNVRGGQMTRQGFWKVLKGYARDCGITSNISPHTLRHSFAFHMIQNGSDIKSLQEMMGHSDIISTQVYESYGLRHIIDVYNKAHPRK